MVKQTHTHPLDSLQTPPLIIIILVHLIGYLYPKLRIVSIFIKNFFFVVPVCVCVCVCVWYSAFVQ